VIACALRIAAASLLAASVVFPCGTRADETTGYTGKGALVVQTSLGDTKLTVGGSIAFEERDSLLRVDVLSLGIPGADPTVSALLGTQLFPPGGFTIVYDRKTSTYTIWSNAKRLYYSPPKAGTDATPQPTPAPPSTATPGTTNGLLSVFSFLRSLKEDKVFTISFTLTGHGPVNGHPATGLTFQYLKTTNAGETTDFHGQLKLADDLNEIPIEIAASVKTKGIPESSFRLDATSIAQSDPPDADFAVPAGYARAASLGDVVGKVLPT
jgi:hypothetical protein